MICCPFEPYVCSSIIIYICVTDKLKKNGDEVIIFCHYSWTIWGRSWALRGLSFSWPNCYPKILVVFGEGKKCSYVEPK